MGDAGLRDLDPVAPTCAKSAVLVCGPARTRTTPSQRRSHHDQEGKAEPSDAESMHARLFPQNSW
jgi:hypothetical protein